MFFKLHFNNHIFKMALKAHLFAQIPHDIHLAASIIGIIIVCRSIFPAREAKPA